MAVLAILRANDPRLRRKARRVSSFESSLARLIEDMVETMRATGGVGLAATQVGIPLRVAVIEVPGQEVIVLVNPEIVRRSGERAVEEGCLSLSGYRGQISRSEKVTVKARDRQGKEFRVRGEGLLAQALEHELDHLNGVLYFDHLESRDQLYRIEAKEAEPEGA